MAVPQGLQHEGAQHAAQPYRAARPERAAIRACSIWATEFLSETAAALDGDAVSEGGCHIGPRHCRGRAGEQVQMRTDDAQILVRRFVKHLAQPREQVE